MPQPEEMNQVSSSNIAEWGYDAPSSELWINFNSGGGGFYSGVPTDVAEGMREAPSKGSYHAQFLKHQYPYTRVS